MQDHAVPRSLLRFHVFCNPGWRCSACVLQSRVAPVHGGAALCSVFVLCNPGSRFAVQRLPVENFLV